MFQRITHIFAGFIIIMCLALAYFMAFTELMSDGMTDTKRQIFVVILIGYAIYRAYRLYIALKTENNESFEDEEVE